MNPPAWRVNVQPAELVAEVTRTAESAFVRKYAGSPFLAVRIPAQTELAQGLTATVGEAAPPQPVRAMEFNTQIASLDSIARRAAASASKASNAVHALRQAMMVAPHYVVALRKRASAEGVFQDRVSVGRASNKDVVLRHGSISKFHAWFQIDDLGNAHVADAGSKNGTYVNAQALLPREVTEVVPGCTVRFGSVHAMFVDAETLWRALSG